MGYPNNLHIQFYSSSFSFLAFAALAEYQAVECMIALVLPFVSSLNNGRNARPSNNQVDIQLEQDEPLNLATPCPSLSITSNSASTTTSYHDMDDAADVIHIFDGPPPYHMLESKDPHLPREEFLTRNNAAKHSDGDVPWRNQSCVLNDDDQEEEVLPDYTCTVYKIGRTRIKQESIGFNKFTGRRPWRDAHVELWGTLMRFHYSPGWIHKMGEMFRILPSVNSDAGHTTFTFSLAGADACRAFDYIHCQNVLRLTTAQGDQFLLRSKEYIDTISWIEHLQAGINIALDLECRPMPAFVTLPNTIHSGRQPDARLILLEQQRDQRRREQQESLI